jgi:hypothetical protein
MKKFDERSLNKYRNMDCTKVFPFICKYFKEDAEFTPIKSSSTSRWNVNSAGRDYELLITRCKWYDTMAKTGGGGAVDLTMHLLEMDFVPAVKLLNKLIK